MQPNTNITKPVFLFTFWGIISAETQQDSQNAGVCPGGEVDKNKTKQNKLITINLVSIYLFIYGPECWVNN